jgi:EAL domain-containing protein (putative c-di-GMP-specific phosphodiesterase class I)
VNLSAQQFAQPDLLERSREAIARAGIPPGAIEFEVTETAAMRDVQRTAATLAAMRELGVHVSIDDFGTGYSSLNYLRRFAVDAIKIDKSFIDDIGRDRNAEAIVDAILRLGQSLGTSVVAEGVESEAQVAFLRQRRCDEVQGYYFGRPVPPEEFERMYLGAHATV